MPLDMAAATITAVSIEKVSLEEDSSMTTGNKEPPSHQTSTTLSSLDSSSSASSSDSNTRSSPSRMTTAKNNNNKEHMIAGATTTPTTAVPERDTDEIAAHSAIIEPLEQPQEQHKPIQPHHTIPSTNNKDDPSPPPQLSLDTMTYSFPESVNVDDPIIGEDHTASDNDTTPSPRLPVTFAYSFPESVHVDDDTNDDDDDDPWPPSLAMSYSYPESVQVDDAPSPQSLPPNTHSYSVPESVHVDDHHHDAVVLRTLRTHEPLCHEKDIRQQGLELPNSAIHHNNKMDNDDDNEHMSVAQQRSFPLHNMPSSYDDDQEDHPPSTPPPPKPNSGCSRKWTAGIRKLQAGITRILHLVSQTAAHYPKSTMVLCPLVAMSMLLLGWVTNFTIETSNGALWPPKTSLSRDQVQWFYYNSSFHYDPEVMELLIHANGDNVLSKQGVERVFEVQQAITNMENYQNGCSLAELLGQIYYIGPCRIHSVAQFWNQSLDLFHEQVLTDDDAMTQLSSFTYPNGVVVDLDRVLGNARRFQVQKQDPRLVAAQSYVIQFDIPRSNMTTAFVLSALQSMLEKQAEWKADPDNPFSLEVYSVTAYGDEFMRAIVNDLPLLPAVFFMMSVFTCFVFSKWDKVQSRATLGFGAVVCIVLSIMTGYGLLFACGVPFTTSTTMLPFLMFGIGLDDSFILFGSYSRTNPNLDPVERIRITIDDVGTSIFLTSLTSSLAFFMGVFSQIPAVSWVCLYAFPTIIIDLVYQLTFFIALMVMDERRVHANRMDVCCCRVVAPGHDREEDNEQDGNAVIEEGLTTDDDQETVLAPRPSQVHFADQIMGKYATIILIPWVQNIAILLFLALLGWSIYGTFNLRQKFNYVDLVPTDSYLRDYFLAKENYATTRNGLEAHAYFRLMDQSNPEVQFQMQQYIDDLVEFGPVDEPVYFWLRDFRSFLSDSGNSTFDGGNVTLADMTFDDQVGAFLSVPIWNEIYSEEIAMSKKTGEFRHSRCSIHVRVDMTDPKASIDTLNKLRSISASQPMNQGVDDWRFYTYQGDYHLWEFYSVVVSELTSTTIVAIITITIVAVIFIPHWTAVLFVFPFISFLYLDMLGFLHFAGVEVNAISYITLVLSIGLMVDFIMHILLRYYECSGSRQERVKETLQTMGSSIVLGAVSTFLGVLLLMFSTSVIIQNVFVSFIGLVTFGILHGLLFLPVLLSMIGPQ